MPNEMISKDLRNLYEAVDVLRGKNVGIAGVRICSLIERVGTLETEREQLRERIGVLEAENEKLKEEAKQDEISYEAIYAKFEGCPHKPIGENDLCGCSFDAIGDVCAYHSPALRKAQEQIARLEEMLRLAQKDKDFMQHLFRVAQA